MTTLAITDTIQEWFFREEGSTEAVQSLDAFMHFLWWHSVFWFVLLMGLTAYFVIKYRRRPGNMYAVPSPSHNTWLETFWTVVPSLTLIVIFLFGFWGYIDKMVSRSDALELNIKGAKWSWALTYPDGSGSTTLERIDEGGVEFPVYYVPENTNITLRMSSTDVIHSFWIPDMRVKMDVMPNRYTGYSFTTPPVPDDADKKDMWVFCAEYCGDNHAEMASIMRVVSLEKYEEWNRDKLKGMNPIKLGEIIFKTKCVTCHRVDATENSTAPSWKGGAQFLGQTFGYGFPVQFNNGTSLEARDANYIRESILNPQAKVVAGYAGNMPSFDGQLADVELEALIAYYQSLSEHGPKMDDGAVDTEEPAGESPADAATQDSPTDDTAGQP
ncbi:MAG: cytochrome c oxidase subunit 2 [Phycisphaeraceae bacterium]|nr:MAG: cytochrome c oxidase subunit 2 [Phycisphaeraceae bacterium]